MAEEILVTSPTRVKCLNANGDGYNYIYIDDSCVQLEVNMSPDLKTTFGVSSQEIYVVSNDPSFLGIRYQYGTTTILDENTLVPKSYVDIQKLTTAEILAIENPEIGKQYFNLDNNLVCYHNGSDWKKILSENL